MKTHLAKSVILSTTLLWVGCQSQEYNLEAAMQKSTVWLWSQQGDDGGWHSETHTVLSDGKVLTPYILYHLLQIPENRFKRPEEGVEKGIEFIRRNIMAAMDFGRDSLPILNYPNYSAAYALKVLCLTGRDTMLQEILFNHLLREQFTDHRGIGPDHLAYGGWGYGETDLQYGQHGHVDISHTRRIVEALITYLDSTSRHVSASLSEKKKLEKNDDLKSNSPADFGREEELLKENLKHSVSIFLQGVQRSPEDPRLYEGCVSRHKLPYDGGFISSVVTLSTNKSQPIPIEEAGNHYPSYATATCDGFLALHALQKFSTSAYAEAAGWLRRHQHMYTIDGLQDDDPGQWHQIMQYYHLAVRTEAMTAANISGPWSSQIAKILVDEQTKAGYYINPLGGVNKEDDPLLATVFAIESGFKILEWSWGSEKDTDLPESFESVGTQAPNLSQLRDAFWSFSSFASGRRHGCL